MYLDTQGVDGNPKTGGYVSVGDSSKRATHTSCCKATNCKLLSAPHTARCCCRYGTRMVRYWAGRAATWSHLQSRCAQT